VPGIIGRVSRTIDRVPACSAESLSVRPSARMFIRVPGLPVDSFLRGNSRQRGAVSVFNPQDSEVPLPPDQLERSW
jgi:hypothetical protein